MKTKKETCMVCDGSTFKLKLQTDAKDYKGQRCWTMWTICAKCGARSGIDFNQEVAKLLK